MSDAATGDGGEVTTELNRDIGLLGAIRVRLRSHLCVEGVSHSFVQGEA